MPPKGWRKEKSKDKVFQLRISEEEYQKAIFLADRLNKSVSQYIRDEINIEYNIWGAAKNERRKK